MCRILYRLLVSLARLAVRSGRSKDLEIIVLRHQLTVLHRQNNRPALADEDRALLGAIAAALPDGGELLHRPLQHACLNSGRQHRRGWLDYNMPRLVVVASCCECLLGDHCHSSRAERRARARPSSR